MVAARRRRAKSQSPDHVWCRATGRQAEHDVTRRETLRGQVALALSGGILRAFNGMCQRAPSSRNDGRDHARRDTESRHAFRGVEHRQASAGARTNVDQTPAARDGSHDKVDRARDRRQFAAYRARHSGIFAMNRFHDAAGRALIEA